MEHEEIKKKAKQRVDAKKGFFVTAFTFGGVSVILIALVAILPLELSTEIWILFPILIFALILGIMYLAIFGIPGTRVLTEEWEAAELRHEMNRLYREKGIALPPADLELTEEDELELKELERLKQKWEERDDFV